MIQIHQYDCLEYRFRSDAAGALLPEAAVIEHENEVWKLPAFRVSGNEYAVRFMPESEGVYQYEIQGEKGAFACTLPAGNSHGPVRTKGDGFAYGDGSKYLPFGTTCYAWTHQPQDIQDRTVETLRGACFNKIRMLLFPKFMPYNEEEPAVYPFEKRSDGSWDVDRIVPAYWDNLDRRLDQLADLGIEADLILFHPYDKWGFMALPQEDALAYVRYCVARLGAHRNVWWSLANEYELLGRPEEDWDEYGKAIAEADPYHHLISIHQIINLYPQKDWMTHLSIQSGNINNVPAWKEEYGMPVIIDECGYEGNIEFDWGNLTAFEMVNRFWWSVTRGGYCTHGETFHREDEVLWWGKGGVLYGESEPRIRFLKELLYSLPGVGTAKKIMDFRNPNAGGDGPTFDAPFLAALKSAKPEMLTGITDMMPKQIEGDGWILRYYGHTCPCISHLQLDGKHKWSVDLIDVWAMTVERIEENVQGSAKILLPGREGMAVLIRQQN